MICKDYHDFVGISLWEFFYREMRYLFGRRRNEIDNLIFLIARDAKRLHELVQMYSPPDHCCPSCASAEYRYLYDKNTRRIKRLRELGHKAKNKKLRNKCLKWFT